MATRTQVTLDAETQRRARERAAQLGISFAEHIRRLVATDLGERVQRVEPSAVFNLGSSCGADVARDKDTLVGEAVAAELNRNRARR
jgi:putative heme degradation protein